MPYQSTIEFWDQRFQQVLDSGRVYQMGTPHPWADIENALAWLCERSGAVLDFGCGTGSIVIRSMGLGMQRGLGIDISPIAIEVAQKAARENGLVSQTEFIAGGVEQLTELQEHSFECCVLFNLIDNILPVDARRVLDDVYRVLRPGGRLLIKLNQNLPPEALEDDYFTEVAPFFYSEKSGLYLWDLKDETLRELLKGHFEIHAERKVFFPESERFNRLFQLIKLG